MNLLETASNLRLWNKEVQVFLSCPASADRNISLWSDKEKVMRSQRSSVGRCGTPRRVRSDVKTWRLEEKFQQSRRTFLFQSVWFDRWLITETHRWIRPLEGHDRPCPDV